MGRYRLMDQRAGTFHRLLCPKECLPKLLGSKRPYLHRSPRGFFAPFPVLFGHRSFLLRLLTYSPLPSTVHPNVKLKNRNCDRSWTFAYRRLLCLQSRSKSAPSAKLKGGSSGDRPLSSRARGILSAC